MENAAPIRSIKSSARLFGMTAAWPVQMQACARRSLEFRSYARSSGSNLRIVGTGEELNQSLEKANRISDFLELAELMCVDALQRTESCGGHFRVESQTADGEAKRDDDEFCLHRRLGVEGCGPGSRPSQRTAHLRVCSALTKELQVAMNLTLRIWRQQNAKAPGSFITYQVNGRDTRHVVS